VKRFLVIILLMAAFAPLADAQLPSDPTSVEIGWDSDVEPMVMELNSNYNFELVIKFWVENSRLIPVDIEFEVETFESFIVDDPGKVTVPANSNETFELVLTGSGIDSDGLLLPSTNIFKVTLKANLMLGEQSTGQEEIEKEIKFSQVYGFEIDFEPLFNGKGPEVKSGSDKNIEVVIKLAGNTRDSILRTDMSFRGCPQMDYNTSDPIFSGGIVESQATGEVNLMAPSSHPDKDCKFVVTITSEGNGNSYSGELEFTVDAPEVKEEVEDEEESISDSSGLEVEDNSLPAISSLLCIFTMIFSAVFSRKGLQ